MYLYTYTQSHIRIHAEYLLLISSSICGFSLIQCLLFCVHKDLLKTLLQEMSAWDQIYHIKLTQDRVQIVWKCGFVQP
jgi:hypothetical protein